jgi:hypothetical protein
MAYIQRCVITDFMLSRGFSVEVDSVCGSLNHADVSIVPSGKNWTRTPTSLTVGPLDQNLCTVKPPIKGLFGDQLF